MGVNYFTDMTNTEFQAIMLMDKGNHNEKVDTSNETTLPLEFIKPTVDWRKD